MLIKYYIFRVIGSCGKFLIDIERENFEKN